jgi:hypothetical protein
LISDDRSPVNWHMYSREPAGVVAVEPLELLDRARLALVVAEDEPVLLDAGTMSQVWTLYVSGRSRARRTSCSSRAAC